MEYLLTKGREKLDLGVRTVYFEVMDDSAVLQLYDVYGCITVTTKYECIVSNKMPQVVIDRCRHYKQKVPETILQIVLAIQNYLSDVAAFSRIVCDKFKFDTLRYAAWYIAEGYERGETVDSYQKRVTLNACQMLDRGVLYDTHTGYELYEFNQD